MKKQSLVKGTMILGITSVFAKFLGIFFRWPIIMLIGDEGIGYYQLCYPIYMCFIGIASGFPVAISKIISEKIALNDEGSTLDIINKAFLLMLLIGGGFSLLFAVFPNALIDLFNWDRKTYYSLIGISIAPFFISIMSVLRGYFQGLHNMTPTAVSQVIEQIGRVIFGVGLAFLLLPKGIEVAAGGAAFGAAAGAILGTIYLLFKYISARKKERPIKINKNIKNMTELLTTAIPISVGALVGSIMSVIDSVLVTSRLLNAGFDIKSSTILYGQLTGKAQVLINVPLTLSLALGASLIPIIAEAYILRRNSDLKNKINIALKLGIVVAIPSFVGLYFLASPIISLIFPNNEAGANILMFSAITIPFIIMTQITTSILQGTNHFYAPIKNLLLGCVIKVILTYVLVGINNINIYGAIISSICAYVIIAILNIRLLYKKLNFKMDFYELLLKPCISAIIMIITVVLTFEKVYNITQNNKIACLITIIVSGIVYVITILMTGMFKLDEIKERLHIRGKGAHNR